MAEGAHLCRDSSTPGKQESLPQSLLFSHFLRKTSALKKIKDSSIRFTKKDGIGQKEDYVP